jgi:hypothetical protein
VYLRLVLVCGACLEILQFSWVIGTTMGCYIWYQTHDMAYVSVLDAWTYPRGDVSGLGLIDEDVSLLRG